MKKKTSLKVPNTWKVPGEKFDTSLMASNEHTPIDGVQANAEFIVRAVVWGSSSAVVWESSRAVLKESSSAVNSHDALLEAAKEADRILSEGHKGIPIARARNRARDVLQKAITKAEGR